MFVCSRFNIPDILQSPIRSIRSAQLSIESLVGWRRVIPIDIERPVNRQEAGFIQDPRGDLRNAFHNSDGRDMKQIDCEDNIVAICLGVRPSLRLGEVYVDGVPDIGIGVLGLHLPDRLEHTFIVIGGLKPDVRKMRRERVDMRAAAAREQTVERAA